MVLSHNRLLRRLCHYRAPKLKRGKHVHDIENVNRKLYKAVLQILGITKYVNVEHVILKNTRCI